MFEEVVCDDVVLLDVLLDDVSFDDVPVELLLDADEFSLSLSTVNGSRESSSGVSAVALTGWMG